MFHWKAFVQRWFGERVFTVALLSMTMTALVVAAATQEVFANQEVLTLGEAADFLRVKPEQVEQLARQHRLPSRRIGNNEWRFSRTALLVWLSGENSTSVNPVSSMPPSLPQAAAGSKSSPVDSREDGIGGTLPKNAPLGKNELPLIVGRGAGASPKTGASSESASGKTPDTLGEKPDLTTAEEVFLRDQGILLKAGQLTMEGNLFYSRSERQDLILSSDPSGPDDPIPELATLEEDTFLPNLSLRYGLRDNLQLSTSVPWLHQKSTITTLSQRTSASRTEWGDVTIGVLGGIVKEGLGYPNVILSLEGRIPTGESSYSVGGSLALTKSLDPAVLIANLSYLHTFSEEFEDISRLEPENTIAATFGYAYALNDTLTLSTAVSGVFTTRTRFGNITFPSSEQYSIQFGLTSLLTNKLYIEPVVSFGLSGVGSDVSFGVNLPYTFNP